MRTFYRAVHTWPPAVGDFCSDADKGHPPRPEQQANPVLCRGISVFDTPAHLDQLRRRFPRFPPLTAELLIPNDAPVQIEKTRGPGHWTIQGDPVVLLTYAVRLVP